MHSIVQTVCALVGAVAAIVATVITAKLGYSNLTTLTTGKEVEIAEAVFNWALWLSYFASFTCGALTTFGLYKWRSKPANIYWTAHDIMWTIIRAKDNKPVGLIRHGLKQAIHQATSSRIFAKSPILNVLKEEIEKLSTFGKEDVMNKDEYDRIIQLLDESSKKFGEVVDYRQIGYKPYPEDNKQSWLDMKRSGET